MSKKKKTKFHFKKKQKKPTKPSIITDEVKALDEAHDVSKNKNLITCFTGKELVELFKTHPQFDHLDFSKN